MRTRSEYRRQLPLDREPPALPDGVSLRHVDRADEPALARLLLDAYRGTIDDEGETEADAEAAIGYSFACLRPEASFVATAADELVAMSFVVIVGDRHYIDPVATAARWKERGVGTAAVLASVGAVADSGATEIGAVITDGNVASERLFAGLGFTRVGPWPPTAAPPS